MKEARNPGIAAQLPWIARRRVTGGRHDVSAFRRCWMKLLREVPRFGTRIFSNEEFGLESNFRRGRGVGFWSVIRVGLRFLMFFF